MKNVFLVYDNCCFYEIIILSYFMRFTGQDTVMCSLSGEAITCMEGYSVNVDTSLNKLNIDKIKSFIIPGGNISSINSKGIHRLVIKLAKRDTIISAICSGVDILDDAGILKDKKSTHSEDTDVSVDRNIITARANAYVDFAIEVAKKLRLFKDERDLNETIDFWKYHKRIQQ